MSSIMSLIKLMSHFQSRIDVLEIVLLIRKIYAWMICGHLLWLTGKPDVAIESSRPVLNTEIKSKQCYKVKEQSAFVILNPNFALNHFYFSWAKDHLKKRVNYGPIFKFADLPVIETAKWHLKSRSWRHEMTSMLKYLTSTPVCLLRK